MTYQNTKKRTIENPAASYWLKKAVAALDVRDPLDALADAEMLAAIAKQRTKEICQ